LKWLTARSLYSEPALKMLWWKRRFFWGTKMALLMYGIPAKKQNKKSLGTLICKSDWASDNNSDLHWALPQQPTRTLVKTRAGLSMDIMGHFSQEWWDTWLRKLKWGRETGSLYEQSCHNMLSISTCCDITHNISARSREGRQCGGTSDLHQKCSLTAAFVLFIKSRPLLTKD